MINSFTRDLLPAQMVVPGDQELGTDDVTKFWLQEDGDITYVVSKCDRDAASVEDIPARLAKRKNCRVVACTVRHIGRGCFSRCAGFAVASLTQACHFPTFYFVSMYARTCQAAGAQVDDEDAVNELLGCDDEGTKYIRGTRALLRTWPVGSPSTPKRQRQILSRAGTLSRSAYQRGGQNSGKARQQRRHLVQRAREAARRRAQC